MQVIKIGTDMSVTRQTIKANVFKPWWNLPTRSMEDYAEEELRHMHEEEEARKNDPEPIKRYKQLSEEGLEDDIMVLSRWMTFRKELAIRSGFELFVATNTTFGRLQRRHVFAFLLLT